MDKKFELMIEPLPGGFKYGFPRALPEEAVMGKGADLWVNPSFDLVKWISSFGFPEDGIYKWKYWPEEVKEMCGGMYEEELKEEFSTEVEKMGDLKFTTASEFLREEETYKYVYPGSDCQE